MYNFSTIQRDIDTFYVVGGQQDGIGIHKKILKFEANVWSHVGDLQISRQQAALAFDGNELLIIGGWGTYNGVHNTFPDNDAT